MLLCHRGQEARAGRQMRGAGRDEKHLVARAAQQLLLRQVRLCSQIRRRRRRPGPAGRPGAFLGSCQTWLLLARFRLARPVLHLGNPCSWFRSPAELHASLGM